MTEEQLKDLRIKSREFGVKASELSHRLEQAQAYIDSLSVKMPVQVQLLRLQKDSDKWRLCYGPPGQEDNVVTASVPVQAAAALHLPGLLTTLHEIITEQLEAVEAGLASLSTAKIANTETEAACQTKS